LISPREEDVPILVAPNLASSIAKSNVFIPPDALTPLSPNIIFIKTISSSKAPEGPNPVDVLIKSALAIKDKIEANTFSSKFK